MHTHEDRARILVARHLNVTEAQVTKDANFVSDLGADSLDTVEIVMLLEEEFDIEVQDDDAEKVQTFGDAIALLNRLATVEGAA